MPSASNRQLALIEFVKRLRHNLSGNIVDVRLFGSEARGEATPESDIDVLVVVRPDGQRVALEDRIVDLAFDVNLDFGVYISPRARNVVRGSSDFRQRESTTSATRSMASRICSSQLRPIVTSRSFTTPRARRAM